MGRNQFEPRRIPKTPRRPRRNTSFERTSTKRSLKRYGDFGFPANLGSFDRPLTPSVGGEYPTQRKFGDTIQPTIVERWNFDQSWSRWKIGYNLYLNGLGIIDRLNYFCEIALPDEVNDLKPSRATWQIEGISGLTELLELFYFPGSAEEGGYLTLYRRANALVLPFPILSQRVEGNNLYVTLDGTINDSFKGYIGDRLGDGLDSQAAALPLEDVVSYLLIDVLGQELVFDLPSVRGAIEDSHYLNKTTRQFILGRFLSTAPKIVCTCPDCLSSDNQKLFSSKSPHDHIPTNSVGSLTPSRLEEWATLFKRNEYRVWRPTTAISQSALNAPAIRACKHIYAVMFYEGWRISEPNEYPTQEKKEQIEIRAYQEYNVAELLKFQSIFYSRRFIYLTPLIYAASIALNLPDEILFNSYFLLLPPGYYSNPLANRSDIQNNPVYRFEQPPLTGLDQQRTGTEATPLPIEQFNTTLPIQIQLKNTTSFDLYYQLRPFFPGVRTLIPPGEVKLIFPDFTDLSGSLPIYFLFDPEIPSTELFNKLGARINVAPNPTQQTIFLQLEAKRTDPAIDIIYFGPDGKISQTFYIT